MPKTVEYVYGDFGDFDNLIVDSVEDYNWFMKFKKDFEFMRSALGTQCAQSGLGFGVLVKQLAHVYGSENPYAVVLDVQYGTAMYEPDTIRVIHRHVGTNGAASVTVTEDESESTFKILGNIFTLEILLPNSLRRKEVESNA